MGSRSASRPVWKLICEGPISVSVPQEPSEVTIRAARALTAIQCRPLLRAWSSAIAAGVGPAEGTGKDGAAADYCDCRRGWVNYMTSMIRTTPSRSAETDQRPSVDGGGMLLSECTSGGS